MTRLASSSRPVAIVLGCGDVGSAAALALHHAGLAVVLADEADPSWHRRGMVFTNAWYVGNAELENEGACFCSSLKSIPSILARRMIAATTWSWPAVAATREPVLLVDARGTKRRGTDVLRGRVPLTIGIGGALVDGENVDIAIDFPAEFRAGRAFGPPGFSHPIYGFPTGADANVSSCEVAARRPGRFMTERRIGDVVRVGHVVGGIGNEVVAAPHSGVLLGLAARGARVEPGDTLVEVDPDGLAHRCYGIGPVARRLAASVVSEFVARTAARLEPQHPTRAMVDAPWHIDRRDAPAGIERKG